MTKKKFFYHGRRWTIQYEGGVWYFNAMIKGQRYHKSLYQTHVSEAVEMAKAMIDRIFLEVGKSPDVAPVKHDSWGVYLEKFESMAGAYVKQQHVNHYRNIVARVLEDVLGPGFRSVPTSKPSVQDLEQWKTRVIKSRAVSEGETARAKRYINDMLRQVSTLTGRTWQTRLGIMLGEGAENINRCGRYGRVPRPTFRPSEALIDETIARAEKELLDLDLNAYKAFWFAMGTGARRGEIKQVRWEHFDTTVEPVKVVADFVTKDGDQAYLQFVYPKAWEMVKAVAPEVWQGPYLGESSRVGFEKLGKWMKSIGWTGKFKLHELRAAVVTKVYQYHGIAHAQAVARHKNASTTDKYIRRRVAGLPEIDFLK